MAEHKQLGRVSQDHVRKYICKKSQSQSGVESEEYLSVEQLSRRIPYKPKTIRNLMWQGVFVEGIHFTRLTGRPIFIWSRIEQLLREGTNGCKGQG